MTTLDLPFNPVPELPASAVVPHVESTVTGPDLPPIAPRLVASELEEAEMRRRIVEVTS